MSNPDRLKVADKIRKLLALSQSPNVHEAERAAALAAELMARHQVSEAMVEDDAEMAAIDEASLDTAKRRVVWKASLLVALARATGCEFYLRRDRDTVDYRVVGRVADIDAVRYLYLYLRRQIEAIVAAESRRLDGEGSRTPGDRSWQNSFRLGLVVTVSQRLTAARRRAFDEARADQNCSQALVRIEQRDLRLREYMSKLGLRRAPRSDIAAFGAYDRGRAAGENVHLGDTHAAAITPGPRLLGGS